MNLQLANRELVLSLIFVVVGIAFASYLYTRFTATHRFAALTGSSTTTLIKVGEAFNSNNFTSANAILDARLSTHYSDIEALLLKAITLAQQGSLQFRENEFGPQAIAVAKRVLAIDPKNADAYRVIGYAHEIMQEYDAAHDAYNTSLALDPNNPLTLSQQAHAYDLAGNNGMAEEGYRKALALAPSLDQALMGLGRILSSGRPEEAFTAFNAASISTINVRVSAEAQYSAALIRWGQGDHVTALSLVNSAIVRDPNYPLAYVGRAQLSFSKATDKKTPLSADARDQMIERSFEDLERALSLNEFQTLAHYQYALQIAAVGHPDTGLKVLHVAQLVLPKDITLTANEKADFARLISAATERIKASKAI